MVTRMTAARHQPGHPMTVAEFLAYDDGTLTRYELVGGVMVAINPPHPRHAVIVDNIGRALERQVWPPCRVFRAEVGVALGEDAGDWREPDILVTCRRPEGAFVRFPRLVVEVLSPSTEKDDRTTKLDFYETIESLGSVLLVWQDERRVRLRGRGPGGWADQDVIASGTVRIEDLGAALTLDEIYADPWAADTAPGEG
jgi:Uma2 family endonuclease